MEGGAMTKAEFLVFVTGWSAAYDAEREAGADGFGDEKSIEDWTGSIAALYEVLELAAGIRE